MPFMLVYHFLSVINRGAWIFPVYLLEFPVSYIKKFQKRLFTSIKFCDTMKKSHNFRAGKEDVAMLRIAICDDDDNDLERVNSFISNYKKKNGTEIRTFVFKDGNDLLLSKEKYDMIFLDIEMKHTNGIEVAQKIRESDMNVPIVYVTSYPEYWKRAYKVHAFDYIEKPIQYNDIETVFRDFMTSADEVKERPIGIMTNDGLLVLDMNSIIYIWLESKRKVKIYTVYKDYVCKESLSEIMCKLDEDRFYRVDKNYIINLKFVTNYKIRLDGDESSDGVFLINDIWVPIAKKRRKEFYAKLSEQLRYF